MDTSLLYIATQITIYGGFIFLFAGIFGNSMNIFIFTNDQNYRKTPCSFYFLIGSIFNNLYIIINLTTRIIDVGYNINPTLTSVFWCKMRNYLIITLSVISFTCSCLAAIDQYLVTSRNIYLRQYSNIKSAHRIIFIVIIIWCLHGIPCFLFIDIVHIINVCTFTNTLYHAYIPIFVFIFLCAMPMLVMIIFGYLTYRNIHQTTRLIEHNADRQLVKMVLIQTVLVSISNLPFGCYSTYNFITSGITKDINRQIKEYSSALILALISYSFYVGNFYMFFISSSRFRQTVKNRLVWWRMTNRINPLQTR